MTALYIRALSGMDHLSELLGASPNADQGRPRVSSANPLSRLLRHKDGLLAITIVVVLVIVLTCSDPTLAIAIIAAILGFYVGCMRHGHGGGKDGRGADSGDSEKGSSYPRREQFWPMPGAGAPYAVYATPRRAATAHTYPGAIDIDEYDSEAVYGHRDRTEGDNDFAPVGNPFNTGRIAAPLAAEACIDDEANDDELDGDERITYQARARNDETRVAAGTINRRQMLDQYLREETAEAEDREWWGRHEE